MAIMGAGDTGFEGTLDYHLRHHSSPGGQLAELEQEQARNTKLGPMCLI